MERWEPTREPDTCRWQMDRPKGHVSSGSGGRRIEQVTRPQPRSPCLCRGSELRRCITGKQCKGIHSLCGCVRRTQVQWRAEQNSDPSTHPMVSLEQVTWCSMARNSTAKAPLLCCRQLNLHYLHPISHNESNSRMLAGLKIPSVNLLLIDQDSKFTHQRSKKARTKGPCHARYQTRHLAETLLRCRSQ